VVVLLVQTVVLRVSINSRVPTRNLLQGLKPLLLGLYYVAPKGATYNDGSVHVLAGDKSTDKNKSKTKTKQKQKQESALELDGYILFHCGLGREEIDKGGAEAGEDSGVEEAGGWAYR
jgi:hypothetical protein